MQLKQVNVTGGATSYLVGSIKEPPAPNRSHLSSTASTIVANLQQGAAVAYMSPNGRCPERSPAATLVALGRRKHCKGDVPRPTG